MQHELIRLACGLAVLAAFIVGLWFDGRREVRRDRQERAMGYQFSRVEPPQHFTVVEDES